MKLLRSEILQEIAQNPVLETDLPENAASLDALVDGEGAPEAYDPPDLDAYGGRDEETIERRERLFNSQTATESLEDHLLAQIPLAGFTPREAALARELVGHIDEDGYFRDAFADLVMTTGAGEGELRGVLAKIRTFDPEGCGSVNLKECYLAQLDRLEGSHLENESRIVIEHLDELAAGRKEEVCAAAGIELADLPDVLALLRSLDPAPGRAFARNERIEKIWPDVEVRPTRKGWVAFALKTGLPPLKIRKNYVQMLENPDLDDRTRDYLREKLSRANAWRDALERRGETLQRLAATLAGEQSDFLLGRTSAPKPLTIRAIAPVLGLHEATVSRAVAGKWMKTPRGTVQMRDLFTSGFVNSTGEMVSQKTVETQIRHLVEGEDRASPLSDQRIAEMLSKDGYVVARRTVAKYREKLGIPPAAKRKIN